jgi:hypothetical protein
MQTKPKGARNVPNSVLLSCAKTLFTTDLGRGVKMQLGSFEPLPFDPAWEELNKRLLQIDVTQLQSYGRAYPVGRPQIRTRGGVPRVYLEQVNLVLVENDYDRKETAKFLGLKAGTIQFYCAKMKSLGMQVTKNKESFQDLVKNALEQGMSRKQIAAHLNATPKQVGGAIRRLQFLKKSEEQARTVKKTQLGSFKSLPFDPAWEECNKKLTQVDISKLDSYGKTYPVGRPRLNTKGGQEK